MRNQNFLKTNPAPARAKLIASMLVAAALLAACGASTTTPLPPPAATATTAPTDTPQVTSTPTSLDPCLLLPSEEVSTLAGTTYGAGVESTTPEGLKICTYGYQTASPFTIDVAQAKSVDEAKADKAQFLADLQANLAQLASQGLTVTELPNFADGATMGHVSVSTPQGSFEGSAIGFLKGTVFFGFSVIVANGTAPTDGRRCRLRRPPCSDGCPDTRLVGPLILSRLSGFPA